MAENKDDSIEIKDFEPFLRKCLNCDQLKLIKLETSKLVGLGENYSSVLVKLDAIIRKTENDKEEELHYLAKKSLYTEQAFVNWTDVFLNETYIYTELLPIYKNIEEELGIKNVFDAYPKYIGHRYSLDGKDIVSIEHSMLVLENLKPRGFYTGDKYVGLDLEHTRLALKAVARYHALGIALKNKRPETNILKRIMSRTTINADFTSLDMGFDSMLDTIRNIDGLKKHLPVIEDTFAKVKNGQLWGRKPTEPWATIIHGDFWLNNMMFRKDEQGKVVEIKLIDFQICMYNSPLKDLPTFLCCSVNESTKINHLHELLDLYYDSFSNSLKELKCDVGPFSKESFDRELKQQAIIQFPLCALAFKFLTFHINEQHSSSTLAHEIFTSKINDEIVRNLNVLVGIYERMGWF